MKTTRWILVAAFALGLAGAASAAAKASLTATNNTIGGPGTIAIAAGATERIFVQAGGNTDVCANVVNTGKEVVTVSITGDFAQSGDVPVGATKAVCANNATAIDLSCAAEGADCAAQWRVDDN